MDIRALGSVVLLASIGCGLDESGLLPIGDAGPQPDGALPLDAPSDVVADVPVDAGPCVTDAAACTSPDVPSGWTPVAYKEDQTTDCLSPFTSQQDVITNLDSSGVTCGCTCSKTTDPGCTTGKIATHYSGGPGCGTTGQSLTFSNGGCIGVGGNLDNYYASDAIGPVGGSCTTQATSFGTLKTTPARLCAPDPSCTSAACGGYAPPGFAACIVVDGDQTCPSGSSFTKKHTVAASATVACTPTCSTSCSLQGTCASPKVQLFSDGTCTSALATFPSDGTCNSTGGGSYVGSATYTAAYSYTGCVASGSTTVQVNATTQRTLCCR